MMKCPSTKSALERLEKGMKVFFDVVILDDEMPDLDAYEFSKRNSDDIVVIMKTTSTSPSSMEQKAIDCGVSELWLKPLIMTNIISMEMLVWRKKYASLVKSFSAESSSSAESSCSVTSATWKRGLAKKSKRDAHVGGGDVEG